MMNFGEVSFITLCLQKRMQVINLNQFSLKINDTYRKDEKIATNVEILIKNLLSTKVFQIQN